MYHSRQRVNVNQFQALHHFDRPFLVFLEMCGLDMALVGLLVGVDFEDVDFARVFLGLHREEGQHAGFHLHRGFSDFLGEGHIFLQKCWLHFDFGEADDAFSILLAVEVDLPYGWQC